MLQPSHFYQPGLQSSTVNMSLVILGHSKKIQCFLFPTRMVIHYCYQVIFYSLFARVCAIIKHSQGPFQSYF